MITTDNQFSGAGAQPNISTQSTNAAATAASDFNSFLKLLTAQLRHQDPLSPLDSTQFVQQLASFSSVEQQIETNKKLETLSANLIGSDLENATQWIGKEIETANGATRFDGDPISYGIPQSENADQVEVMIVDAGGNLVLDEAVPAGTTAFTWDGETADGETVPNGDYLVQLNYYSGDEMVDTQAPIAVSRVTEARLIDSAIKLVLDNGAVVEPADILAVREPGQAAENDS